MDYEYHICDMRLPECRDNHTPSCAWCGRPTRRHGQLRKDHPGTVSYGANGLCTSHYQHAVRLGGGTIEDLERECDGVVELYWRNRIPVLGEID